MHRDKTDPNLYVAVNGHMIGVTPQRHPAFNAINVNLHQNPNVCTVYTTHRVARLFITIFWRPRP